MLSTFERKQVEEYRRFSKPKCIPKQSETVIISSHVVVMFTVLKSSRTDKKEITVTNNLHSFKSSQTWSNACLRFVWAVLSVLVVQHEKKKERTMMRKMTCEWRNHQCYT